MGRLVPASRTWLSPSRSLGRGQWQAPRDSPPRLWSEWAHSPAGGKSSSVVAGRRSSGGGRAGRTWFPQDGAPSPGPHRWAAAGLSPPPCSPVSSLPPRVQDRGHLHPRSQGLWGRVEERGRPAAVGGAVLPCSQLALRWTLGALATFAPYIGKGTRDNDLAALTCDWVPPDPSRPFPPSACPSLPADCVWCVPSRPWGPIWRKWPCVCVHKVGRVLGSGLERPGWP